LARVFERTLTDKIDFVANDTKSLNLPRDYFIQKIKLRITLVGDTGSSVSKATDAPMTIVKKIRVIAVGAETKTLKEVSGVEAYLTDFLEYGTKGEAWLITTTGQSGVALGAFEVSLDFMLDERNPSDFSCLIPAFALNTLRLEIDWGSSSDLGSGYTISSGQAEVHLYEVIPEAGEPVGKTAMITENRRVVTPNQTGEFPIDIDVGKIIRRIVLMQLDGSSRVDTIFTKYKLTIGKDDYYSWIAWEQSQNLDKKEYGVELYDGNRCIVGLTVLDFDRDGSLRNALDTRALKQGDVKLWIYVATANKTVVLIPQEVTLP
jgi:hypothetical protein